jgi:hypothetical protein
MTPSFRHTFFAFVAAAVSATAPLSAVNGAAPSPGTPRAAAPTPNTSSTPPTPAWDRPAAPIEGATLVSRNPLESSVFLGTVYKSETDGFRVTPPAGSRIIKRSGIDLMSFVVDARSWGGSVQRIVLDKVMSLEDFVKTTKNELITGGTFKGVQILNEEYLRKDNFPAARLNFSMEAELGPAITPGIAATMGAAAQALPRALTTGGERVALYRQQFIARIKDNQFMVLIMYTPLKDRTEAATVFNMMLGEYELFDPVAMKQHRMQAADAGKAWLARQTAEQFLPKLMTQSVHYRMLVGGKDVGYLRFDENTREPNPKGGGALVEVDREGRKGLLLHVNFRSFPEDGSVIYGQNEAFWSYSKTPAGDRALDYSCWTNVSKTRAIIPVPPDQLRSGQPTVQIVTPWRQEAGTLSQEEKPHKLFVTLTGDATQRLPQGIDRIIPVEATAPLPKFLEYTWTRMVDLTKPSEMSFFVFDSVNLKLALRNLIVTGQKEVVTIDGNSVTCFKCLDELDPNSTTIWTDKDGRIQMMRTSDQSVMIPTTEAAMTAKWAARLKDQ